MQEHNDNFQLNDPFLESMFQKLPHERTSVDFTTTLMNQIYASVEPEIEPEKYRRQMLWAYGSIGIGILVIAFILFAIWPFFDINLKLDPGRIINFINASLSIFDGISEIGKWIKESTIKLTIVASIFILFLIERLLRKGLAGNSYIF